MESGIHLVVRTMIAIYGTHAADNAANRARVLEACGDRDTSRYWELVRQRIEDFDRFPPRRGRYFSDDESNLVATVIEAVFGAAAPRDEPEERDDESDADPFEVGHDLKASSI